MFSQHINAILAKVSEKNMTEDGKKRKKRIIAALVYQFEDTSLVRFFIYKKYWVSRILRFFDFRFWTSTNLSCPYSRVMWKNFSLMNPESINSMTGWKNSSGVFCPATSKQKHLMASMEGSCNGWISLMRCGLSRQCIGMIINLSFRE